MQMASENQTEKRTSSGTRVTLTAGDELTGSHAVSNRYNRLFSITNRVISALLLMFSLRRM